MELPSLFCPRKQPTCGTYFEGLLSLVDPVDQQANHSGLSNPYLKDLPRSGSLRRQADAAYEFDVARVGAHTIEHGITNLPEELVIVVGNGFAQP